MASSNKRIQVNSPKGIQNPVFSQAMIHGGLVRFSLLPPLSLPSKHCSSPPIVNGVTLPNSPVPF